MDNLIHADCLDAMAAMDADCLDAIVTDPPYGLGFMGKNWDHGVPGVPFWAEMWRIAKPGAHLLAFGGTRTVHRLAAAIEDAGWEIRDMLVWGYASGFPKSHNLDGEWNGWGTALKPAWEPIVMARKPLRGTVAANVLRHGTGALNIDGTRIPHAGVADLAESSGKNQHTLYANPGSNRDSYSGAMPPRTDYDGTAGRWPANVILTDPIFAGDSGTYSRFFLIPKSARAEREPVLGGQLPTQAAAAMAGNLVDGQRLAGNGAPIRTPQRENVHPTVKPLDLMRHLVRLVTPPGGTVLDPFLGSGTTALAAEMEGFAWIGIEKEAEYVAITEARLNGTQKGLGLVG